MSRQPTSNRRGRNSAGDGRSRSGFAPEVKRNYGSELSAQVSAGCDEFWRDRGIDPRSTFVGMSIRFGKEEG